MRPSDENQNASTRPNLMSSSRRTVAPDDGILASLERGSTNSQMRRSWLVFGATVSLLLTAMVAWLAYNNATSVRALSVEVRPEPHVLAGPAAIDIPAAPPDTTDAPEIQQAAAIVDVPDTAAAAAVAATAPARPPLVMLPPEKGGAAPAPEARPVPREEIAQAPAPAPAAAALVPVKAASQPVPAPARSAAKAKPPQAATRTAEKTRPAARPARALAARPPVKAAAKKTSRSAGTTKTKPRAPEVVDSDVALISAIVAHATHHAAERERQEACPSGKKCPAKPPARP